MTPVETDGGQVSKLPTHHPQPIPRPPSSQQEVSPFSATERKASEYKSKKLKVGFKKGNKEEKSLRAWILEGKEPCVPGMGLPQGVGGKYP